MPRVSAQIPDEIYERIGEEVKLGIFQNTSEAINAALKKAYAEKSRSYLRWLMKKEKISEESMLKELGDLRK
jgi:Arc/MetJ-type ribon-helix-helix transcriptional regulator